MGLVCTKKNLKFICYYSLLLFFICFSISLYANPPRCTDLNITMDVEPKEINVTGKKIGDVVANIKVISASGSCNFVNAAGVNVADVGYIVYEKGQGDRTGIVSLRADSGTAGNKNGILTKNGVKSGLTDIKTWTMVNNGPNTEIYLKKKVPGKIDINLDDLTKGFQNNIYSTIGSFDTSPTLENASVINNVKGMSITYIPTCSATVNDVTFPPTRSSDIQSGTVNEQIALVSIDCDDILPKYSIVVSSPKGMENADMGIIKSENASVGYRLSWKNTGNPVQLGVSSTPYTPTSNQFEIPISVKPIKLDNHAGNMILGSANSSIKIELKFN